MNSTPAAISPNTVTDHTSHQSARLALSVSVRLCFAATLLSLSLLASIFLFLLRDSIQPLAWFYYATPPAVIAALAVSGWFFLRKCSRVSNNARRFTFVFALAQCGMLAADYHVADARSGELKLGMWNVCSGNMGWDAVVAEVHSWDADIIGLAESHLDHSKEDPLSRAEFWRASFPEHNTLRFPGGMRLITRSPARTVASGKLDEGSEFGIAETRIDGRIVYVVMADILSRPTRSRSASFQKLYAEVSKLPQHVPVIMMGDMNTPTRSVHFDQFRTVFRNAFEENGSGFYHSWPMPFPVLPLDQVWANAGIEVGTCSLGVTLRSDHRPILMSFNLRDDENHDQYEEDSRTTQSSIRKLR